MKHLLTTAFTLLPAVAAAHPGHVEPVAGHDHLVEYLLLGLAALVLIWVVYRVARRRAGGAPR